METASSKADWMKPIKEILPHREPFLFLDEIVEVTDRTVLARRTVREEEPQFRGHYPGKPVMPGVLLCETILQAGCYLMGTKLPGVLDSGEVPVVTRMTNAKFRRMVKPNDLLEVRAEYERSMLGAHFMKGTIHCQGKLVLSLEFACMMAPTEAEK